MLRQLGVLAEHGDVTTLGYGEKPDLAHEHLQVADDLASLPQTPLGVVKLAARLLTLSEMAAPALREGRRLLQGRSFDLVVVNEARALPLGAWVAQGAPLYADMHEWAAQERSHVRSWRLLVGPLMDHVCRRYLPEAAAVTTVCDSIAELYRERYGVECDVVRNSRPYVDLEPSPMVDGVLRLAHSGAAVPGRNLEALIDATLQLSHSTLDLILVPANDGGRYLAELKRRAAGSALITFHDAVTPDELPAALNGYDIGVYNLPPLNVNMEYALPNKVFDFLQARLAMVVGPSPEMSRFVTEHELGRAAPTFSTSDFVETIRSFARDDVQRAKESAHRQAHELDSDSDAAVVDGLVHRLLATS